MATRQVNWLRGAQHFDFTGLSTDQIKPRKDKIKGAALVKINKKLSSLRKFKLKSIRWAKERSRPFYYLVVKLTPPAQLVPVGGGNGGGGANITPTPPRIP